MTKDGNAFIIRTSENELYIIIDYVIAIKGKYVADGIISHELGHILNQINIKKYYFYYQYFSFQE